MLKVVFRELILFSTIGLHAYRFNLGEVARFILGGGQDDGMAWMYRFTACGNLKFQIH